MTKKLMIYGAIFCLAIAILAAIIPCGSQPSQNIPAASTPRPSTSSSYAYSYTSNYGYNHYSSYDDDDSFTMECYRCSGSGRCEDCHGSGRSKLTGVLGASGCALCEASGRCYKCNGKGYTVHY
ncbi:MAG: hypothetical protein IKJ65_09745 [Clostridia bacterium]|nr:hypothetical protein [Clostridia bacterium]